MIVPVPRNPPARRRASFTVPIAPSTARRLARAWSRRRARAAWLVHAAWTAVGVVLLAALYAVFLYSAFLAPVEWNAADPDYRAGAFDAR